MQTILQHQLSGAAEDEHMGHMLIMLPTNRSHTLKDHKQ